MSWLFTNRGRVLFWLSWSGLCLLNTSCVSDGFVGSEPREDAGGATSTPADPPPPADVTGTYTITLRYGENGCVLGEWTEGAEAVGIPLTMRQDEELVSGTVEGITGGILTLIHGSNIYQGTIDGNQADMVIYGQRAESSGNCSYSLNNRVNAKFDGDFVQGTLRFVKEGNDNPDCAEVECSSLIDFTGSRPPSR